MARDLLAVAEQAHALLVGPVEPRPKLAWVPISADVLDVITEHYGHSTSSTLTLDPGNAVIESVVQRGTVSQVHHAQLVMAHVVDVEIRVGLSVVGDAEGEAMSSEVRPAMVSARADAEPAIATMINRAIPQPTARRERRADEGLESGELGLSDGH